MKKRKCAAGGVVVGPRSMQDQLIAIRPKFADGGKVDAAEEAMRRMASKYGTAVPPPTPPLRSQLIAGFHRFQDRFSSAPTS